MDPSKLTALRFCRPNLLKVLIVRHYLASAHKDAGGFLNEHEEDDIRAERTTFDQADKFISILLTKDNSAFDKFCELLDEFGQQIWSQKLKDKATESDDFSSTESDSEPDEKWANKEPSKTIPLLIDEYIRIKKFFIQTCKEKGEPELKQIKSHCSDLIQAVFRDKPKYTRLEDDLDRCPSIEEIARILFFQVSRWMGFEFLDRVIEFFLPALREVQSKLRNYKAQLRPVLEEKLVKIRALQSKHPRKCKSPKGLLKLVAKYNLDKDGIYVKDLITERHFLAEKLSVPEDLLQVISWSSGSLNIIFFTLEELEEHLIKQIELPHTVRVLRRRWIVSITIGNNEPIIITSPTLKSAQTATTPTSDSGFASGSGTNVPSDTKTATVSDEQTVPDSTTSTVAGDKDDQASVLSRMVGKTGIMHAPQTEANFAQTFVDNNSLSEHAKVIFCKKQFQCRKDPRIQVDIGHLSDIIARNSPTHEGNMFISPPSLKDSTWERLEKDEATLNIILLKRQLQASSLRMMFGEFIHKNPPKNIVLATCDKEFSGHINSALERGWQVDLWTWDGCFPELKNHPKCGSLLNIHCLDTGSDSIVLVEEVLKPSQFTFQDLTKKLSKSGAMVRVAASVVEHGSLCRPFRERLENAARFPILCYQVTKINPRTGMSEFLVLFISTEGDALCPLDRLIMRIGKHEIVIPNLDGIITFENFKKREAYRGGQILEELRHQCKGPTTTHKVAGSRKTSSRKTDLCRYYMSSNCSRGKSCPWPHSEDKVWCPRCREYGHIMNTPRCKYCDLRGHPVRLQQQLPIQSQSILNIDTWGYTWGYYLYDETTQYSWQQQQHDPQQPQNEKDRILEMGKSICHNDEERAKHIFGIHERQKAKQPVPTNLGGTPTVQELRIICHYILRGQSQGLDWRQIPLQLGIVGDKVQLAVEAFPNEPSRAIYTALDYWRNGQGLQQPTWTSLLRALVNANFQNVAMAIEDKLKKGEPLQ